MSVKSMTPVCSALIAATTLSLATAATAQDAPTQKTEHVTVVSAQEATRVDLGSKKTLGYYGKQNGKCDLTVMVIENQRPGDSTDVSASRLKMAVTPGTAARIDSAEGRSVEYFCATDARRMFVRTLAPNTDTPRS